MSPQVPESATPVAEAPAPKKVRKPKAKAPEAEPAKKTPAKAAKKPAAKPEKRPPAKAAKKPEAEDRPDRSAADASVQERRVAVVKMLRKLHAENLENACPIGVLAEKLGYTKHDVYCLVFHQYPLVAEGFVTLAKGVQGRGISAYLTRKGLKSELDAPPFTK